MRAFGARALAICRIISGGLSAAQAIRRQDRVRHADQSKDHRDEFWNVLGGCDGAVLGPAIFVRRAGGAQPRAAAGRHRPAQPIDDLLLSKTERSSRALATMGAPRARASRRDVGLPCRSLHQGPRTDRFLHACAAGAQITGHGHTGSPLGREIAGGNRGGRGLGLAAEPDRAHHRDPALGQAPAEHPRSFDVLWAASFAIGDAAYLRPIYEYYAAVAAQPGVDVHDIVTAVLAKQRNDKAALEALGKKYPREALLRVVFASSALWSLELMPGSTNSWPQHSTASPMNGRAPPRWWACRSSARRGPVWAAEHAVRRHRTVAC